MAEEIINIATLTIDKTEANKSIVETKQAIFELQKANTELRKDITKNGDVTGEQTKKFVENEQQLKKLTTEYKTQSAAINDLTLAELKENKALTDTVKSRDQAIAQTKELKAIRGQLNTSTVEGAQALELLNKKIDANDAYLRANSSALEKQKDNVGNYGMVTENLSKILTAQGGVFSTVRTQVEGFKSTVSGSVDTVKSVHASVVGAAQGIIGFGNASKAAAVQANTLAAGETVAAVATEGLAVAEGTATVASSGLATVLGVLLFPITAIIAAGLILYNVFKDFSPVINPIKDAIASLGAVFVVLKTAVLDLVTGARSLGDVFSSLGSDIADATVETYKLEGAQRALTKAMDIQELSSARTATKVKELILQSKDLTKTVEERTALINKAQALEEKEFQNRFKNYKTEKEILIRRLSVGKTVSEEEKQRLREGDYEFLKSIAKKRKLDTELVEAYKKNQLSREQLLQEDNQIQEKAQNYKNKIIEKGQAKQEKAEEKARAAAEKALAARVKAAETEISVERAKNAQLNQTNEQRLAFINSITKKELALVQFKNSVGVISEREAQLASINIAKTQSSEILALAQKTIDDEIEAQNKKIEEKKKLSEQDMLDEVANAAFLREAQIKRIEESKLLESEKALALEEIQKGYNANIDLIGKTYKESRKAQAEIDRQEAQTLADTAAEMRILALQEQGAADAEIQKANLDYQYEQKLAALNADLEAEKKTAAEVTAIKTLEDKKYAAATKKINDQVAAAKRATNIGMVKDSLSAAASIFGENKAVAVAMALVNTYEGISAGVKLGYPAAIPAVAAAAATGFAAVKNILKTDKSGGGGGGSSSGGSTTATPAATFENVARTQTVATVNAPPVQDIQQTNQPVLILETLSEAQKNQIIKINSK